MEGKMKFAQNFLKIHPIHMDISWNLERNN